MKLNSKHILGVGILSLMIMAPASYADSPFGMYKRPNGTLAKVWDCGGNMCAVVASGKQEGFNMFLNGIKSAGPNTWKGSMKHPKMGKIPTFNGTVIQSGKTLMVKGCMIGGFMCDKETWVKQ